MLWYLIEGVLSVGIPVVACTGLITRTAPSEPPQPRWEPPHTGWRAWAPPPAEEEWGGSE